MTDKPLTEGNIRHEPKPSSDVNPTSPPPSPKTEDGAWPHLTVGDLRKKLEGLDDDMPVYIQRIEDVYFNKHGWIPEELIFDPDDKTMSDYVLAFCGYKYWYEDKFIINGHY